MRNYLCKYEKKLLQIINKDIAACLKTFTPDLLELNLSKL
jgi:hypothetical protein